MKKVWYKPKEIAVLGLITNKGSKSVHTNYQFIYSLIQEGKLPAQNYSKTDYKPYYLVHIDAIKEYNKESMKYKKV